MALAVYSGYTVAQLRRLRRLETDIIDRNRRDSLLLVREATLHPWYCRISYWQLFSQSWDNGHTVTECTAPTILSMVRK